MAYNRKDIFFMKDYVNYARKDEPKQGVLFVDFVEQTVSRKCSIFV